MLLLSLRREIHFICLSVFLFSSYNEAMFTLSNSNTFLILIFNMICII